MEQRRKTRVGRVVSDKMQKTVVVLLERMTRHPVYGKTMLRRKRVKAHDARDECRVGDTVLIEETRPLSREKRWRVASILSRREVAEVSPIALDQAQGAAL
ncbi:MAG TPA: 30S ribosomal protein S17 [Dehalococcoidia bacterium]|uniref:Small ribosomal subunit protein uS17 n=2 Tax=environmental samples TaxID=58229 RepID=A0A0H4T437_9CHLR|nr:30S ribosomal protein S17 [uncultured Chloroflexi bacterium Rifle_16ft_4_minimus_14836]AKQ05134.1 30S ribosomal protein S17 [uncultured Chloroflexi bacterium Rifle_16ft_4_minimus_29343]HLF08970.1 30S ribosomal protein S17 [Dehalococcoidia bacterium]